MAIKVGSSIGGLVDLLHDQLVTCISVTHKDNWSQYHTVIYYQ